MPKGIDGNLPLDTDTGFKTAGTLGTGWTADTAVARRYGNVVNVVLKNLDYSSGGDTGALTLKEGFRPDYTINAMGHDGTNPVPVTITSAGVVTVATSVDNLELNVTYLVTSVWPSF